MYHIKRESWFGGTKLNGVNFRRLMDQYKVIINIIRDSFIDMNKGTVAEDNINIYCDKHKRISNVDYYYCNVISLHTWTMCSKKVIWLFFFFYQRSYFDQIITKTM